MLLVVGVFIIFVVDPDLSKNSGYGSSSLNSMSFPSAGVGGMYAPMMADDAVVGSISQERYGGGEVAPTDSAERLVVQTSEMSVQVENVVEISDQLVEYAKGAGGFMVSSSLSRPEEAASATLVIRVPQEKLKETLEFVRGKAVKVVAENLWGTDVTDQYEDIEAKLETYFATKTKLEEILAKAVEVKDILAVQSELINLQSRIDRLKGQQQYLEKTAALSKITIYLDTDEFALPYAPSETWRPGVIFKLAVRSLVGTLRGLGETVIWVAVYAPVWLPVLAVIWFIRRRNKKKVLLASKTS